MGQYNITIAKFYRVSGGSTQNKGVIPDIMFPSAFPPEEFGESSQPTALPWDRIAPADFQAAGTLNAVKSQLQKLHQARMDTSKRSEEHTSELQSLMRISYAVFCLKKKKTYNI